MKIKNHVLFMALALTLAVSLPTQEAEAGYWYTKWFSSVKRKKCASWDAVCKRSVIDSSYAAAATKCDNWLSGGTNLGGSQDSWTDSYGYFTAKTRIKCGIWVQ